METQKDGVFIKRPTNGSGQSLQFEFRKNDCAVSV